MRGIFALKLMSPGRKYGVIREDLRLSVKAGEFLHQWFIFAPTLSIFGDTQKFLYSCSIQKELCFISS
jgi:hypothetical protein